VKKHVLSASRTTPRLAVGLLGLGTVVLAGCAVGPRYSKPATVAPPQYKELPPNWKSAQPADQIAKGMWWELFEDPQLNSLEEQINVSNQSL
jgi:outer membrane protein TolC